MGVLKESDGSMYSVNFKAVCPMVMVRSWIRVEFVMLVVGSMELKAVLEQLVLEMVQAMSANLEMVWLLKGSMIGAMVR